MDFIIVIFVIAVAFIFFISQGSNEKRKRYFSPERNFENYEKRDFRKERAQKYLNIVRQNTFQKKRICNKLERAAYLAALSVTLGRKRKERVLVEVNLGEVLYHPQHDVHEAINGKRVDVLVATEFFEPLVAFEIDGSGHNLSDISAENDEIKNLALASAGIPLFRIDARHDNPEQVKQQVRAHLYHFFSMDHNEEEDIPL